MTKPNGTTPTLEQRVAAALQDDSLNATQLSNLLDEIEQAIPSAEQAADQARAAACDPLQTSDLHGRPARNRTHRLTAARLKALLPRLQTKLTTTV